VNGLVFHLNNNAQFIETIVFEGSPVPRQIKSIIRYQKVPIGRPMKTIAKGDSDVNTRTSGKKKGCRYRCEC
jgi:hypothetical protein